jgi:hypothetical protein
MSKNFKFVYHEFLFLGICKKVIVYTYSAAAVYVTVNVTGDRALSRLK